MGIKINAGKKAGSGREGDRERDIDRGRGGGRRGSGGKEKEKSGKKKEGRKTKKKRRRDNIKKPEKWQKIAMKRVKELLELADERYEDEKLRGYSHKYVKLAWSYVLKYKLKLSKEDKDRFCKKCLHFLKPGKNYRVRSYRGRVIKTCLECGHVKRVPIERKKAREEKMRERGKN